MRQSPPWRQCVRLPVPTALPVPAVVRRGALSSQRAVVAHCPVGCAAVHATPRRLLEAAATLANAASPRRPPSRARGRGAAAPARAARRQPVPQRRVTRDRRRRACSGAAMWAMVVATTAPTANARWQRAPQQAIPPVAAWPALRVQAACRRSLRCAVRTVPVGVGSAPVPGRAPARPDAPGGSGRARSCLHQIEVEAAPYRRQRQDVALAPGVVAGQQMDVGQQFLRPVVEFVP